MRYFIANVKPTQSGQRQVSIQFTDKRWGQDSNILKPTQASELNSTDAKLIIHCTGYE